ncbi:MAG: glutamate-1-semialdehyde 2,1-aminomutase [Candidatus Omnitrophica bacterium]|nr:glutamate-1-semialdehyde 2,1-aminomutase [Candidatus Omnitrophota bacterium]
MKKENSSRIFSDAKKIMVGGVNSPARSFQSVGGQPLVMKYGRGSKLYDEDGNSYTDYCLSWGALIFGHAHRNAILAAKKTVERGISFGTSTRAEVDIARHIVKCVPSIEMVRFVNSGTEATMSAIRLARGYTKRPIVIKFDGCYHGHVDDLLTAAGSGVANLKESSSLGIPKSHIENTISLPYNNVEVLEKTLATQKDKIACVILEPVAGNMGVIPADVTFLKTLRNLTKKYKIVLIFDEIMSGFRTNPGCVQADVNITPDMTCLGKIVGGGFPIGVYGGRKDIMRCLAPLGGVYQAGTFSGNPVVMRAGLATLKLLNNDFYAKLNQRTENFAKEINAFFEENDIDAYMSNYKGMMSIRFAKGPVKNYKDAQEASSNEKYGKLFNHLLKRGIYWPPADLESFFVSGMHSKKDLAGLMEALKEFFKE